MDVATGTVIFYNAAQYSGFIKQDETGELVYFSAKDIGLDIYLLVNQNSRVEFEKVECPMDKGKKTWRCDSLKLI